MSEKTHLKKKRDTHTQDQEMEKDEKVDERNKPHENNNNN